MQSVKMETPSGLIAEMMTDCIFYRHYRITKHAAERYIERVTSAIDELFVSLDRAVLAERNQQKDVRVMEQIRRAEDKGGYVLVDPETRSYFFIAMEGRAHSICTVMTLEMMTFSERRR